jgi:hypothetical protein
MNVVVDKIGVKPRAPANMNGAEIPVSAANITNRNPKRPVFVRNTKNSSGRKIMPASYLQPKQPHPNPINL